MSDRLNAIENQIDQHLDRLEAEQARHEAIVEWFEDLIEPQAAELFYEFLYDSRGSAFFEWLDEYGTKHGLFPFDKRPDE